MTTQPPFMAVLFDMDGTLVDSDGAVARAWTAWAREYGVDEESLREGVHGRSSPDTVRAVRPDLGAEQVALAAQRQLELQYDDLDDVVAAPGARGLLDALDRDGIGWAVVTSADARLASRRLASAGIEAPVLVTVSDVRAGKPDPEGYVEAARRLGTAPFACLVVEDSPVGAAAGHAAGSTVAGLRGAPADVAIASLDDLHGVLEIGDAPGA